MNRCKRLKQRARRNGVFVIRALDGKKGWDVVDACGPRGLVLPERAALNLAVQAAQQCRTRVYVADSALMWHRWNCEKVASSSVAARPCKCQYLKV